MAPITQKMRYIAFILLLAVVGCSKSKGGLEGGTVDTTRPTLRSISISPPNISIAIGTTFRLSASGTYSDGKTQGLEDGIWMSSVSDVATVGLSSGIVTALKIGETQMTVTAQGVSASSTVNVVPVILQSIAIEPANTDLFVGKKKKFKAIGLFNNGAPRDLTDQEVTWSLSSGFATIDNTGMATGVSAGETVVTATASPGLGSIVGTTTLRVGDVTLTAILLSAERTSIATGTILQFKAEGTYIGGPTQILTDSVTWRSSNPSVATISPNGLVTGVAAGGTSIEAIFENKIGQTFLTVENSTLVSITIAPDNAAIFTGTFLQYTATGTFSNGTQQDLTHQVFWQAFPNGFATISNVLADKGKATANNVGMTNISASALGKVSPTATLTVTDGKLVSISIESATSTIAKGTTQQYTAKGLYDRSPPTAPNTSFSTLDITLSVTWSSNNAGVATINKTGLGASVATGTALITATIGSVSGTTPLTVTSPQLTRLSVTPLRPLIFINHDQQFVATGIFGDGSTQDMTRDVTWTSGAVSIATIDVLGKAIGRASGPSLIKAEFPKVSSTVSNSTTLQVNNEPLSSISITPVGPIINAGTSQQFKAIGTFESGSTQDLTDAVTWTSSLPGVAVIDRTTGLARALSTGGTTIAADFVGKIGSTPLSVVGAALGSISIVPGDVSIPVGIRQQFTAVGAFGDGRTQDITSSVTWTTSSSEVGTINNAGLATTINIGTTSVKASFGSIFSTVSLEVNPAALSSVLVAPENSSLGINTTRQYTATANFSGGSSYDVTAYATFNSSNPSIATIDDTGLATGIGTGSTNIMAGFGGQTGSASLEVKQISLTSIRIEPPDATIPVGITLPYKAIGVFNDSSEQNLTHSVVWFSQKNKVATISNVDGSRGEALGVGPSGTTPITISAVFGTETGSTGLTVVSAIPSDVIAGGNHTCARMTDGKLRCWGQNFLGQLGDNKTSNASSPVTVDIGVGEEDRVILVAPGGAHTCAVLVTGLVKCWGSNKNGQLGNGTTNNRSLPTTIDTLVGVSEVVSGLSHSCAVQEGGGVRCWGDNIQGQLGDGSNTSSLVPVGVSITTATALAAGGAHTCALLQDGKVKCWGKNSSGQLGNSDPSSSIPVDVPLPGGIATAIAAGGNHTCALLATEEVYCWGENQSGQLGIGSTSNSNSPVRVSGLTNVKGIAAGESHTCALVIDSVVKVKCWGKNNSGQLGNTPSGNTPTDSKIPADVIGFLPADIVMGVSAGGDHSCALLSNGKARCWGLNRYGQLGNGQTPYTAIPNSVPTISSAQDLSAGYQHTCVALSDGTISCMGNNPHGQLGNGGTLSTDQPVGVTGMTSASLVTAGGNHTCAGLSDGAIKCWGANTNGQLGNKDNVGTTTPVSVFGITTATSTAAGGDHVCALLSGGTVQCWGNNASGQLGNNIPIESNEPVPVSNITTALAIASGNAHTCAVLTDGRVWCWGDNSVGQLGDGGGTEINSSGEIVPVLKQSSTPVQVGGISDATAIATGHDHACARLSNGTVKCWGDNASGQLGDENYSELSSNIPVTVSPMTNAIGVTAGRSHTCALLSTGRIKCWGDDTVGQLGNGAADLDPFPFPVEVVNITTAQEVSAGSLHTCARLADGTVQCWGDGNLGQVGSGMDTKETSPVDVTGL
jgi:alpha-tubulin suppressor-like RCC1 family protein